MNGIVANIVGLVGSALFIAGFIYANVAKSMDKRLFNFVNIIGAILLLASLSVHFNLAAVVLEAVWGLIAFIGLVAALREGRAR